MYTEDEIMTFFLDVIRRMTRVLAELDKADYIYLNDVRRRDAEAAIDFISASIRGIDVILQEGDELTPRERMAATLVTRVLERVGIDEINYTSTLHGVTTVLRLVWMGRGAKAKEHPLFRIVCAIFSMLNLPVAILDLVREADVPQRWTVQATKPD